MRSVQYLRQMRQAEDLGHKPALLPEKQQFLLAELPEKLYRRRKKSQE
jgi:hypothetical protein